MHSVDGSLSCLTRLKRYITFICEGLGSILTSLNMSRLYITEFSEHGLETIIVSSSGKALDKKIEESTVLLFALLTSHVREHLNLFAIKLEDLRLSDGSCSRLLSFKLDITKTSSLAIWVELKLARSDWSKL